MEMYLDAKQPISTTLRNLSDVPFSSPKDVNVLMGNNADEDEGKGKLGKTHFNSVWDAFLQKRKEGSKGVSDMGSSDARPFMWQAVGYLIRFCHLPNQPMDEYPGPQPRIVNYNLPQDEYEFLLGNAATIISVIDDCRTKIAAKGIAQFYTYLSYENKEYSTILSKELTHTFATKDHTKFKPHLRVLKAFLALKDSLQEFRVPK